MIDTEIMKPHHTPKKISVICYFYPYLNINHNSTYKSNNAFENYFKYSMYKKFTILLKNIFSIKNLDLLDNCF